MRHRKFFILYMAAFFVVFLHPNPEPLIVKAVERAGLVIVVVRGLKGHYDDFTKTLNGDSDADKKGNL